MRMLPAWCTCNLLKTTGECYVVIVLNLPRGRPREVGCCVSLRLAAVSLDFGHYVPLEPDGSLKMEWSGVKGCYNRH